MHLNLSSSLGTRTRLSQHIHRRWIFPSSSSPGCFFLPLITLPGSGAGCPATGWSSTGTSASSTKPSPSSMFPKFPVLFFRPNSFGSGCEAVRLCLPDEVLGRVGEPDSAASGSRGSGLLLLLVLDVGLPPRWGALLLELDEDPARMREGHVGGMPAAARHRNPSRRSHGAAAVQMAKRLSPISARCTTLPRTGTDVVARPNATGRFAALKLT